MKFNVYVSGEELTDYTIIPMSEQLALDESLDQAFVQLKFTDKQNAYRPFTTVVVNITDDFQNTRQLSYFVSSDNKTEIVGTGTYSHDLLCIEQSKWLERFLTGTKTVTNPLVHDYFGAAGDIYVHIVRNDGSIQVDRYEYSDKYKSIMIKDEELEMISANQWFFNSDTSEYGRTFLYVTLPSGTTQPYQGNESPTLLLTEGKYLFDYYAEGYGRHDTFSIYAIRQEESHPNKTITDAVNSLLATVETLRESETPRFSFNDTQATKYSSVDSPEFTLTGTLWEALRQIGTYIHSIPRLKDNVIYFDELGGNEKVATKLTDYVSNTEKFDIEQFATAIDSTVQNIVNLDDFQEGSIVEPYRVGYKTPRTETGTVQITTENMFIQTKEPIEKVIKVEVGYLNDDSGQVVGDITPYVYEQAEYDALSSYEDDYPYAKAYAIKYAVGQKNIKELNFKLPNAISTSVFSKYSIINIIQRATGKTITNQNILKLQFRVTYIPITTTRVKQIKPYVEDLSFDSTLVYNQSAQKISSTAYGEAMKGAIARLGNPQITKVFILNNLSLIPRAGQLYDNEYYISVVKCEYYNDFVKCSLGLSKDFNKLNEYVGINSEERFYEISEKQAEDRYVPPYEDYCIIDDKFNLYTSKPKSLLYNNGINGFKYLFGLNGTPIDAVKTKGYSNSVELSEVILPVISYGIGNSSIFTFHYDDNYSAGDRVFEQHGSTLQNQEKYTDDYGEIDNIQINFVSTLSTSSSSYNNAVEEGNELPLIHSNLNVINIAGTSTDPIKLKKDNREKIIFTYQIHYIANNKNIIIGSLPNKNSLVRNTKDISVVTGNTMGNFIYILKDELPRYAKSIDLTRATKLDVNNILITDILETGTSNKVGFIIQSNGIPTNGKAWAIALDNGELLVGGNKEFTEVEEQVVDIVSFEFTRKLS